MYYTDQISQKVLSVLNETENPQSPFDVLSTLADRGQTIVFRFRTTSDSLFQSLLDDGYVELAGQDGLRITKAGCEHLKQLNDAGSTLNGWQPIETAPKDGTQILVYDPETDHVYWVAWDEEQIFYPGCEPTWTWIVPGSHQDEQGGALCIDNPTLWQPVPAKP